MSLWLLRLTKTTNVFVSSPRSFIFTEKREMDLEKYRQLMLATSFGPHVGWSNVRIGRSVVRISLHEWLLLGYILYQVKLELICKGEAKTQHLCIEKLEDKIPNFTKVVFYFTFEFYWNFDELFLICESTTWTVNLQMVQIRCFLLQLLLLLLFWLRSILDVFFSLEAVYDSSHP